MNPYFCETCCARYDEDGDCKTCPEEVLLDLRDDDVIGLLENFDSSRFRKKTGMYGSLGLGFTLLPIFILWEYIDLKWVVFLYGTCNAAGTTILARLFPP